MTDIANVVSTDTLGVWRVRMNQGFRAIEDVTESGTGDLSANVVTAETLTANTLTTTGTTTLGDVANVHISGGTTGQFLKTNGAGVLNWGDGAAAFSDLTGTIANNQFSDSLGISANTTFTADVTLGAVGDVTVTGGTDGQVLTTDGAGVLSWEDAAAGNNGFKHDTFTANGTANSFTLTSSPVSAASTLVTISGIQQIPGTHYTTGANTLNFFTPPPADSNVFALTLSSAEVVEVPGDDTITAAMLKTDSVTTIKITDLNVTAGKLASTLDLSSKTVTLNAAFGRTDSTQTWVDAQRGSITANTAVNANIAPDFATTNHFDYTLTDTSIVLNNPTNIVAGQGGSVMVRQDGTGSRTLSFGSYWKFPANTAPTLSTTADYVDRIDYFVANTTHIQAVATLNT